MYEAGVALGAIQGLNAKFEADSLAKDAKIGAVRQENDILSEEVRQLAAAVQSLAQRK